MNENDLFVTNPFSIVYPKIDDNWIVYMTNERGGFQLKNFYVKNKSFKLFT